jgi:ankyrin repeat protein
MNNMDGGSLLHQSCRLYPKTAAVVESALRIDPNAIRKAVPVASEKGQARKGYGYPINLAITHGASVEVIKMLIQAGPDVLVQKDGTDGSGSLGIALANNADIQVIEVLLQANPECVEVADRRGNYPLHVAVSNGASFQIVKRLHSMYPMALQMRNFHSQTPLDIAQRSTRCSEEVMNFLQTTAFSPLDVHHLDQHNSADLEDGLDDIMETNF